MSPKEVGVSINHHNVPSAMLVEEVVLVDRYYKWIGTHSNITILMS